MIKISTKGSFVPAATHHLTVGSPLRDPLRQRPAPRISHELYILGQCWRSASRSEKGMGRKDKQWACNSSTLRSCFRHTARVQCKNATIHRQRAFSQRMHSPRLHGRKLSLPRSKLKPMQLDVNCFRPALVAVGEHDSIGTSLHVKTDCPCLQQFVRKVKLFKQASNRM